MRRYFLTLLALVQTIGVCSAQSGDIYKLDVWTVYSNATGIGNASAYVLWPRSFAESEEGLELYSSIESYTGDASAQVSKAVSDLKSGLADLEKMRDDIAQGRGSFAGLNIPAAEKKEYLDQLDEQIKSVKEQIAYYSSMSTSDAPNGKDILRKVLMHSINNKVYHGALYLGRGLWAVSESANEDGPRHLCLGNWGVIDGFGRTVVDFKYDLIMESDEAHGIIKYGTGFRGNGTLYGLLRFNGTQALPCENEQLFLSEGNYIAAVLPNASHAYLYDWNMNRIPTADICYTEPWTKNGETFYPAIDRNGKVGVYDNNGKLVVPFIYDRGYYQDGYWFGLNGNFPKKTTNLEICYDGVDVTQATRYDIHTWKRL